MLFTLLLCCLISYLVGALPFGLWIGLIFKGVDIRTLGSQNIGATNVLRVFGFRLGVVAMFLDTVKGMFGVVLARYLLREALASGEATFWMLLIVGLLAILGHTFSIFLRFKGGKGVASTFGVMLGLSLPVALIAFGVWLALVGLTRYVSLASIVASVVIPVSAYLVLPSPEREWLVGLGAIIAVLVTVRHRANIGRLLQGTEAKIGQRVQAAEELATREAHPASGQEGGQ